MFAITTRKKHLALWLTGALAGALPAVSAAGPMISFGDQGFVTLNYALQIWMQNQEYTSPGDSGDQTDFFLRRNRVTLTGQYNDYVGFYAQLDSGSDSRDGVDDRAVFYRDAYITVDYSDPIRFIAGRFKNTFSRENLEACLEPLTLDRSPNAFTPFAGSRDTGVAMWGNILDGALQYRVMLADGRESEAVAEDNPRMTARIHWSPLDPEYSYGYLGTYLGTQKVFTVGLSYDYQPKVAYSDFNGARATAEDYSATTADVFFEYPTAAGTFTASAAVFDYSVGEAINADPDPELPITSELDASYVKVGYLLPNKVGLGRLQFFARRDKAEYNLDSGLLDNTTTAGGFNYYLDGQRLKLTGEYSRIDYDVEVASTPSVQDNAQTTLGFQLIF